MIAEQELNEILQQAQALRHILHTMPEPALHEIKTQAAIKAFLRENTDLKIEEREGWFYAVCPGSDDAAAPIAFRADHDAVTGEDGRPGHYCGHDGHTAALCAFALYLSRHQPQRTVYLLFQPAEETGEGAKLCAGLLKEKGVAEIYGFHNIPGRPLGQILLLPHTFACASTGIELRFTGCNSHAAYPEAGRNPAAAIAELILYARQLAEAPHEGVLLTTVIGADIGSCAYGVSAGKGSLRLTLRAETQAAFDGLVNAVRDKAAALAGQYGLQCDIRYADPFPATENTPACVEKLRRAAEKQGLSTAQPEEPFRWSEDFGCYLQQIPGAFYGIGSGESCPQLHTKEYEFPDAVLRTALLMDIGILEQ